MCPAANTVNSEVVFCNMLEDFGFYPLFGFAYCAPHNPIHVRKIEGMKF